MHSIVSDKSHLLLGFSSSRLKVTAAGGAMSPVPTLHTTKATQAVNTVGTTEQGQALQVNFLDFIYSKRCHGLIEAAVVSFLLDRMCFKNNNKKKKNQKCERVSLLLNKLFPESILCWQGTAEQLLAVKLKCANLQYVIPVLLTGCQEASGAGAACLSLPTSPSCPITARIIRPQQLHSCNTESSVLQLPA